MDKKRILLIILPPILYIWGFEKIVDPNMVLQIVGSLL